jgi:exopolysaccharide biosynthesis polyprenyl glycosylphosphotransferase
MPAHEASLPVSQAIDAPGAGESPPLTAFRRRTWSRDVLRCLDVTALALSYFLAQVLAGNGEHGRLGPVGETLVFVLTGPFWIVLASWYGLYRNELQRADHDTADEIVSLFHLASSGALILWAGGTITGLAHPTGSKVLVFWATATVALPTLRGAGRFFVWHFAIDDVRPVVVVGTGRAGQAIARKITSHPEYGMRVVAFVDPDPQPLDDALAGLPVLTTTQALLELAERGAVDRAIFSFSRTKDEEWLDAGTRLRSLGVRVDVVPRLFELIGKQAELHSVEGLQLLTLPPLELPEASRMKRCLDIIIAGAALLLLAPLLLGVAIFIRLDSKGPVIYRGIRIGDGGRRFVSFKFRTMRTNADDLVAQLLEDPAHGERYWTNHKLRFDPRVTRVGRVLRRSSLDELPQLVNVLRGDLSLVGPRPVSVLEYERIVGSDVRPTSEVSSWRDIRGYWDIPGARPGLTGLWQISGRSGIAFDERVRLDKLYVANWSLKLDFLIMLKTLHIVATARGAE